MTDAARFLGIDRIHLETMLFPGAPLEGFGGLIGLSSLPAPWRFDGDGAPVSIAGGGDGDVLLHISGFNRKTTAPSYRMVHKSGELKYI